MKEIAIISAIGAATAVLADKYFNVFGVNPMGKWFFERPPFAVATVQPTRLPQVFSQPQNQVFPAGLKIIPPTEVTSVGLSNYVNGCEFARVGAQASPRIMNMVYGKYR